MKRFRVAAPPATVTPRSLRFASVLDAALPVSFLKGLIVGLVSLSPFWLNGEVFQFVDGAFVDQDWESSIVEDTGPGPTHFTSENDSVPSRAGGVRRITHTWSGPGAIRVAHVHGLSIFDPSRDGAVEAVSFDFEVLLINGGSSGGVAFSGLLRQSGTDYRTVGTLTSPDPDEWRPIRLQDLGAQDFLRLGDSGSEFPDFSEGAAPIALGFLSSNGRSFAGNTRTESLINNWRATVNGSDKAVTFDDFEFGPVRWESVKTRETGPDGARFEVNVEPSGGLDGAFRRVRHIWSGPGAIGVTHFREGHGYAPARDGRIETLTYGFDLRLLPDAEGRLVAYWPALRQEGDVFVAPSQLTGTIAAGWRPLRWESLRATDFRLLDGEEGTIPDFSSDAEPLTFGVYSSNGRSTAGTSETSVGMDNWSLVIRSASTTPELTVGRVRLVEDRLVADLGPAGLPVAIYRSLESPLSSTASFYSEVVAGPETVIEASLPESKAYYFFRVGSLP